MSKNKIKAVTLPMSSDAPVVKSFTDKEFESPKRARNADVTLANDLAEAPFYHRNFRWVDAQDDFPAEPWLRTVDKFFDRTPYGPLLIDEPQTDLDEKACEDRKRPKLRARGLLYVILKKGMTLEEAIQAVSEEKYVLDNRESGTTPPSIGRPNGQAPVAQASPRKPKRVEQTVQNVRGSKTNRLR